MVEVQSPMVVVFFDGYCDVCGREAEIVCIAFRMLRKPGAGWESEGNDVTALMGITEFPSDLQEKLAKIYPGFQKRYSARAESEYFVNVCRECGESIGDLLFYKDRRGIVVRSKGGECKVRKVVEIEFSGERSVRTAALSDIGSTLRSLQTTTGGSE